MNGFQFLAVIAIVLLGMAFGAYVVDEPFITVCAGIAAIIGALFFRNSIPTKKGD